MPWYMRYISSCIIFIVIIVVWFFGIYRVVDAKIQKHVQLINTTHDDIQQMRLLCEQKNKLEKACALLQSHALITKNDNVNISSVNCVLTILECIRAAQMDLVSYTIDQVRIKPTCSLYPLHITIRGTMSQLIMCLQKLEALKIALSCTRFAFTRNDLNVYTITLDLKCIFMSS